MRAALRFLRRPYLYWALVFLLFGWLLSKIPAGEIASTLQRLSLRQLAVIAGLNVLIVLLFSSRWWLFLRAQGHRVPYPLLAGYRLAAFAVSYFTPGPQFGGEPLQVYLLRSRNGVPTSAAIAAVSLDKLVELISNFAFIAASLLLGLRYSLGGETPLYPVFALVATMLALPVGYLALLWNGKRPISFLAQRFSSRVRKLQAWRSYLLTATASEDEIAGLFRRKPGSFLAAILFSLLIWACILIEYRLTLLFLGEPVSWLAAVYLLTAARIAFLLPSPGGLGTLEASQMLAMGAIGLSPVLGLSVSLLIRARDLLLSGAGLWIGAYLTRTVSGKALPSQAGD